MVLGLQVTALGGKGYIAEETSICRGQRSNVRHGNVGKRGDFVQNCCIAGQQDCSVSSDMYLQVSAAACQRHICHFVHKQLLQ